MRKRAIPSDVLPPWPALADCDSPVAIALNAVDWEATPVGPPQTWCPSMLTALSIVLHSSQPMLLMWGPELVQLYNDAFAPSLRERHPVAMGQRAEDCWAEAWHLYGPPARAVMDGGTPLYFEDQGMTLLRGGERRDEWWSFGYSPVYDAANEVGGCIVVAHEVTSRVLAQRRGEVLDRLARATAGAGSLEALSDAMIMVLGDDEVVDVPLVWCGGAQQGWRAVGLDDAEGDRIDAEVERRRAELPGGVAIALEEPVVAACTGEDRVTRVFGVHLESSGPCGLLVFGLHPRLDFDRPYQVFLRSMVDHLQSEVRRLEAVSLRATIEGERDDLLEQAPMATALLLGPDYVFHIANDRYIEMLNGRDVLGKKYFDAFPELRGTPVEEMLASVYSQGQPYINDEYRVRLDLDGSGVLQDRWYTFALQPIRGDGEMVGMMAVALDITASVRARKELEEGQAVNRQLLDELRAASKAKDQFLAMLGHELRNPLAPIVTTMQLLRRRGVTGIEQEQQVIERQLDHVVSLVDDLLDMARISRSELSLESCPVQLDDTVRNAAEQAAPLMAQRSHQLLIDLAGELLVSGDGARLAQVFANLLTNAARYTEPGGNVTITSRRDGDWAEVTVTDDGAGLGAEEMATLFEPFHRSHRGHDGGLGLGLAVVRGIVEAHEGTVTLRSEGAGHGTTAVVRLPLLTGDGLQGGAASAQAMEASRALHLLVVDDNHDARDVLAMGLGLSGHTVSVAQSGEEALAWAGRHTADVAILDLGMPDMDGLELARRLRQVAGWERVPLVALTGYGQPSDRERTRQAGFSAHLVKPVELAALESTLGEVVD